MSALIGGLIVLGLAWGAGILAVGVYFVLCKVIYGFCVIGAVALRCSQTPAEAQGAPSWMTLAEEWYLRIPGVLK